MTRRPADRARAAEQRRRDRWERLTKLLDDLADRGPSALKIDQARELTGLYRTVSSDLLEELRRDPDSATTEYLQTLVGRAHGQLRRGTPPRVWRAVLRFFMADFPQTLRRHVRSLALTTLLFFVGVTLGASFLIADPGTGEVLLPFGHRYQDAAERVAGDEQEAADGQLETVVERGPTFAAQLFTHNSRVTFLSFALAVTGGIGTLLLVFANGAYLGAVGVKYLLAGQGVFLAAWILPHGILEIPAILIGSTAGLVLAKGLFLPGIEGRRRALQAAGKDALYLILGATALLFPAGLIEGTISQMHAPLLPYGAKITFALVVGALLVAYLSLYPLRGSRFRSEEDAA